MFRRVESGKFTPSKISSQIEETIQGTPMYRQLSIDGDNISISKRRKSAGVLLNEEENATHRPKFVTQNQ